MYTFNKASMIGLYGQQRTPFVAVTPPTPGLYISYYIIGGGGGGEYNVVEGGGGGGGGQTKNSSDYVTRLDLNKSYSVIIGAGGNQATGNRSTISSVVTAYGGAKGGQNANILGGSGGGGNGISPYTGGLSYGVNSNNGGSGIYDATIADAYGPEYAQAAGGGGGAGGPGFDAANNGNTSPSDGRTPCVDAGEGGGSAFYQAGDGNVQSGDYAGGGGGGSNYGNRGYGGGGAGDGGCYGIALSNAADNTGSGGGGNGAGNEDDQGTGGSGQVVIWYQGDTPKATGGNIYYDTDNDGDYSIVIHVFNTSSNFVVSP
jgi:hypothetical protein